MLFELRNSIPEVSLAWVEARDLFLAGQVRAAWEAAANLRGGGALKTANDYILNVEIARACSAHKTYMALVRLAMRAAPDDPIVRLYHARVLLTLSRETEGIEFLKSCESSLGRTHRAWWGTELANVYASAGFDASCRRWLDEVKDEADIDSPLALYTRSCAREGVQQWDEAIHYARQCVAAAPDWTRARVYLANCLLARGKLDEAQAEFAEAARRGHQEAILDISVAMLAMSLGQFHEAHQRLEALLEDWPQADFQKYARRTLCILLVELGEFEAARRVADGQEKQFALPPIPEQGGGAHCFIPLPLVAQNRNQCVPTSLAMAVYPYGQRFDPDQMFREMHGREGTSLWRMRQWAQQRGFQVVPIRLEKQGVIEMLQAGVPLIGALEGPFNSHVDVVCGFNENLETLYVRDPGHWAPAAWPWEMALVRYRLHAGVLAVIGADRGDLLAKADKWRSDECAALLDLSQAASEGEVKAAEAAYDRIADDSPAAFLRDGYAVNVAISPNRFRERMKIVAEDDSADSTARFRAIMAVGPEDFDGVMSKLLDEDDGDKIRTGARRFLKLLRLLDAGDWSAAHRVVDRLLIRGGGISQFWEIKSDILAELGQREASRECLEKAIELEPLRMSAREKALSHDGHRLSLDEYLAEYDRLLAEDPDDKRLLLGRASILQDGPDGRAFEDASREAIRWFPRLPGPYLNLLNWYAVQARKDLSDRLLDEARAMLPDVFEQPAEADGEADAEDNGDRSREQGGGEGGGDPEPSPDGPPSADGDPRHGLPHDKAELLELVWRMGDPRREAAVARAIELEEAGQLHWHEVARLTACRLLTGDRQGEPPADPESLLPSEPPGAPVWFAGLLCDVLTEYDPPIAVAAAVNEWLSRVVPNVQDHPDLWFQRVLLLENARQMEQALRELRELLERYPATASALYRMGVVKYRQKDYPAAREAFEKALRVNPGLVGAVEGLREVCEILGDRAAALECTRMCRRKFPYSVAYLRDEVLALAEWESAVAAQSLLGEVAADFPERRIGVLRARLALATDQTDKAARLLASIALSADDDDDSFEECLHAKLQVALARREWPQVLELCEQGLTRWPDSTLLKELKAERLAESDPAQARALLRDVLCLGEPREQTAWQYLQLAERPVDRAIRSLVLAAPSERRQELAELFSEVTTQAELLQWNEPFLVWALDKFPDSDVLRYRLSLHYNVTGRPKQALKLAEELYERNPDNPAAAGMLGRCLIDIDAKKALPYLEQVCQQNRSADALFDLARGHQVAGNGARSRQLHWEILEHNPHASASWTNLYLFGGSREKLWPLVAPMLERNCGLDDEYFLVAVVKLALELKKSLPVLWFPLAVERWSLLQTYSGFDDERLRLRRAILAWRSKRPGDVRDGMTLPHGFFESLAARWFWPRRGWIPAE